MTRYAVVPLLAVFCMVGCGSGSSEPATSAAPAAADPPAIHPPGRCTTFVAKSIIVLFELNLKANAVDELWASCQAGKFTAHEEALVECVLASADDAAARVCWKTTLDISTAFVLGMGSMLP